MSGILEVLTTRKEEQSQEGIFGGVVQSDQVESYDSVSSYGSRRNVAGSSRLGEMLETLRGRRLKGSFSTGAWSPVQENVGRAPEWSVETTSPSACKATKMKSSRSIPNRYQGEVRQVVQEYEDKRRFHSPNFEPLASPTRYTPTTNTKTPQGYPWEHHEYLSSPEYQSSIPTTTKTLRFTPTTDRRRRRRTPLPATPSPANSVLVPKKSTERPLSAGENSAVTERFPLKKSSRGATFVPQSDGDPLEPT